MAKSRPYLSLSDRDRLDLICLLRELKTHLASAIESSLPPGGGNPEAIDAEHIALDRRMIRDAARLVTKLQRPDRIARLARIMRASGMSAAEIARTYHA